VERLSPLLQTDSAAVQNTALGAIMVLDYAPLDLFVSVARSSTAKNKVRMRAIRHLGAKFPKNETTPILESLLTDPARSVRRSALNALFSSVRQLKSHALEEALMNLLAHHESETVKISAAKALEMFGGESSLEILESFSRGVFLNSEVKTAARSAIAMIRSRLDLSTP
jgi:HEAT repeat protein